MEARWLFPWTGTFLPYRCFGRRCPIRSSSWPTCCLWRSRHHRWPRRRHGPQDKTPSAGAGDAAATAAVFTPRSTLEDVVNQAAVRATRPPRRPRIEAEGEWIKEASTRWRCLPGRRPGGLARSRLPSQARGEGLEEGVAVGGWKGRRRRGGGRGW